MKFVFALAALLGSLAGCHPHERAPGQEPFPETETASGIIGGTKVDVRRDPLAPSVVRLLIFTNKTDYSTCTGTLVGPRVVLTAGHCVKDLLAKKLLALRIDPSTRQAVYGKDFPQLVVIPPTGPAIAAAAVSAPPEMVIRTVNGKTVVRSDIALIALGTPLPSRQADGAEVPRIRVDLRGRLKPGVTPLAVGYGLVAKSFDPGAANGGERTNGLQKKYLRVIDPAAEGYDSSDAWGRDTIWLEARPGTQPGVTCQGDSGGPMLVKADGKMLVAAVVSRGEKSCLSHTFATSTAAHADWIEKTVAEWGTKLY